MESLKWLLYGFILSFILVNFIPYNKVAPELVKYDEDFLAFVDKYCHNNKVFKPVQKSMQIAELPQGTLAQCRSNIYSRLIVIYNKLYWDIHSEQDRKRILRHEFMHCYFQVEHYPNSSHFMYAEDYEVPEDIVDIQTIEILKEKCK